MRGAPDVIYNRGNHYQRAVDVRLHGPLELFGQTHELMFGGTYSNRTQLYYGRSPLERVLAPAGSFYRWDGDYPEPSWGPEKLDSDSRIRERSLFAAARFNPTDWFHLIAGVRWNRWSNDTGGPNPYDCSKTHVTPYAGILVDFLENHTAYFSYTDIFRPQEIQARDGSYLDPLQGRSCEVGIKSAWFDDEFNTSLALFQTELSNVGQPEQGMFVEGQSSVQAYRQVGKTKSGGIEFEFTGRPTDNLQVFGGVTYWTGRDAEREAINTTQPQAMAKLFATYDFSQWLPGLKAGGGIRWQSRVHDDFASPLYYASTQRFQQGSYALVDLMASYELNEHVTARANVSNLLDRKYWQVGRSNSAMYEPGRSFMVSMDFKF